MSQEEEEVREKQAVHIEVLLLPSCTETLEYMESLVLTFLESQCMNYSNGYIDFSSDQQLMCNVIAITVCEIDNTSGFVPFYLAELYIHLYMLNQEGSIAEVIDGTGDVTAYHEWMLPCTEFDGLWDHLVYDDSIKSDLLRYATSAFLFSQNRVNPSIISLNRVLLLHGPPGTGKTSLCKALAQKLAIRYYSTFSHIAFIEINSHSLFSKWFSESGKLVMKLFEYIKELLFDNTTLLFILIDEVESLSASRKASLSGSEPSDGMRVVNALLTQIDKLKNNPNVMILTTSNLSNCIDEAFVDRADIKRYIGNPGDNGRYVIFRDCVRELSRTGILCDSVSFDEWSARCEQGSEVIRLMIAVVKESEGLSGRALRKLPFAAYSQGCYGKRVTTEAFLRELLQAVQREKRDRDCILR